jgi:hypothetical protein
VAFQLGLSSFSVARGALFPAKRKEIVDDTLPTVLRITIKPTTSGRKWISRIGDRVLCVAAAPFVMSARILLAEGYPTDNVIEMSNA